MKDELLYCPLGGADEILIWIPQSSVAIGSLLFFICVFHQLILRIVNKYD